MSKENVKKFYERVNTDKTLANELIKFTEEIKKNDKKSSDYNYIINEKIIPLAKEKGFDFTADELLNYSKDIFKSLSEEDLATVSGGVNQRTAAIALALTLGSAFAATGLVNMMSNTQTQNQAIMSSSSPVEERKSNRGIPLLQNSNEDSENSKDEISNVAKNLQEVLKNKEIALPEKNEVNADNFAEVSEDAPSTEQSVETKADDAQTINEDRMTQTEILASNDVAEIRAEGAQHHVAQGVVHDETADEDNEAQPVASKGGKQQSNNHVKFVLPQQHGKVNADKGDRQPAASKDGDSKQGSYEGELPLELDKLFEATELQPNVSAEGAEQANVTYKAFRRYAKTAAGQAKDLLKQLANVKSFFEVRLEDRNKLREDLKHLANQIYEISEFEREKALDDNGFVVEGMKDSPHLILYTGSEQTEVSSDGLQKILKLYEESLQGISYKPFSRTLTKATAQVNHLLAQVEGIEHFSQVREEDREALKRDLLHIAKQISENTGEETRYRIFKSGTTEVVDDLAPNANLYLYTESGNINYDIPSKDLHRIVQLYKESIGQD